MRRCVGCRSSSPSCSPPPARPAPSPRPHRRRAVQPPRRRPPCRTASAGCGSQPSSRPPSIKAYRLATAQVERAAATRPAGSWAVVLDADETVIDNSVYQLERAAIGAGFSAESWNAWVKRREATPLPGAGEFLARVRALGGRVAIVTNRLQSECDDTAAVFAAHQLLYDAMLCRPDGSPSDKNPRFEAVAAGRTPAAATPLEVVAFVGDNILDFPRLGQAMAKGPASGFADFGVRYFVVPNPMYGSWQ